MAIPIIQRVLRGFRPGSWWRICDGRVLIVDRHIFGCEDNIDDEEKDDDPELEVVQVQAHRSW